MAIYLGIIGLTVLLGIIFNVNETNTKKKFYTIFIFALLALIGSLRSSNVGVDTEQFTSMFTIIRSLSWDRLGELRYEWGFMIMCKLFAYFTSSYQILLVFTSCFISLSVGRFIYKNSTDVVLSTYIYLTLNIFSMYMNVMRQAIAISIIMFGYEFLKKKRWIVFSLFVLFAAFFHTSAIFALILIPFIYKKTFTKKTAQLVALICALGFLFFKDIFVLATNLLGLYSEYASGQFAEENYFGALLGLVVFLALVIIGVLCKPSENKLRYKDTIHLNIDENTTFLALTMSLTVLCYILGMRMNILSRMLYYFQFFILIWLPAGISSIHEKREKPLLVYLIYVVLLLSFIIINMYRPGWYGIVPYEFYWEQAELI